MSVVYETGRLNLFVPDVKCADALTDYYKKNREFLRHLGSRAVRAVFYLHISKTVDKIRTERNEKTAKPVSLYFKKVTP